MMTETSPRRRLRTTILVAALVAVTLLAAGGVALVASNDDEKRRGAHAPSTRSTRAAQPEPTAPTTPAAPPTTAAPAADEVPRPPAERVVGDWVDQFAGDAEIGQTVVNALALGDGVYVGGRVSGSLPGQSTAAISDAFVRKYDEGGREVWTRQFGGDDQRFYSEVTSIAADTSGVYAVGEFFTGALPGQHANGGIDAYIRKYDSDGNELWTRQFGTWEFDRAWGVAVGATGVYVVGSTSGNLASPSLGCSDAFVRKYDPDGNELWTQQIGTEHCDYATDVDLGIGRVYVLAHSYDQGVYGSLAFGLDRDGNELWRNELPGEFPAGIAGDGSGAFFLSMAGMTDNGTMLRKFDPSGVEVARTSIGFTVNPFSSNPVSADPSGAHVATSTYRPYSSEPGDSPSGPTSDATIQRFDSSGRLRWRSDVLSFSPSVTTHAIVVRGNTVFLAGMAYSGEHPGVGGGAITAFVVRLTLA
jgi:hypothetical protein